MAHGRSTVRGSRLTMRQSTAIDRFRILQWIRATAVTLVLLCVHFAPESLQPHLTGLIAVTIAFTGASFLSGVVVLRQARSSWWVSRAMIAVDASWLATGAYLAGGTASPLHSLILLHLGAVCLLAGYRTGLTLAGLNTVLLVSTWVAVDAGWLAETTQANGIPPGQHVAIFLVLLWILAIATCLHVVVGERERDRRRRDLEALTTLTSRVERSADPSVVAQTLLDSVASTYGLRRGLVLASPEGQLPVLASIGLTRDIEKSPGRPGASHVIALAHERREAQIERVLDPVQDPWLARVLGEVGTLIVVPLTADGRPIGALVVEHHGRSRTIRRMVAAVERSAAYGALALRNAWLMESVQRLAATDSLTKIANRRAFEFALERELARATRTAEYVSLVMLDIDHFKALNDSRGHQAGDEVLRNVAAALACESREFDTPARYGGEEFAVILPGVGVEEARSIAERLRRAIGSAPSVVPITASAGVATYPAHAGDSESLVRAADEALYVSKRAGRNCTTVSAGVPPEEQVNALVRRAVKARLKAKQGRSEDEALFTLSDS